MGVRISLEKISLNLVIDAISDNNGGDICTNKNIEVKNLKNNWFRVQDSTRIFYTKDLRINYEKCLYFLLSSWRAICVALLKKRMSGYQYTWLFLFTILFISVGCSTSGPGLFAKKNLHDQYAQKLFARE